MSNRKLKYCLIYMKIKKGGQTIIYSPFVMGLKKKLEDKKHLDNLDDYIKINISGHGDKLSPLSGSEYPYDPDSWNVPRVRNNNNCYSYVTGRILSNRDGKPQPGYFSHFPPIGEHEYGDCKNFYRRIKKDIPSTHITHFDTPCSKGYFKGFIALDNKKNGDNDYHFYRQDSNRYWSHKPGTTEVINIDASGKLIKNPMLADRKYKYYNYKKPCFFFCVPKHGARTSARSIRRY